MSETVTKNWKTTACGIAMIVAVICGAIVVPILDGNPDTNVDWSYVTSNITSALTMLGIAIPAAIGFIFSKDADK